MQFKRALVGLLLLCGAVPGQSQPSTALLTRTFPYQSDMWVVQPDGVVRYSMESRNVRGIALGEGNGKVFDAAESDGVLWALSEDGLFRIDLGTGTVEGIQMPKDTIRGTRIAVDFDYLWLSAGNVLWQYDKLGMEWLSFSVPDSQPPVAIASDGDHLFWGKPAGMLVFSVLEEKWETVPLKGKPVRQEAVGLSGQKAMLIADAERLLRFRYEARLWEELEAPEPILDIHSEDTTVYLLGSGNVVVYEENTGALRRLDMPELNRGTALAKGDTTLFVACEGSIVAYDLGSRVSESIEYATTQPGPLEDFLLVSREALVCRHGRSIGLYDRQRSLWEFAEGPKAGGGKRRLYWDNRGLGVRWLGTSGSVLKGMVKLDDVNYRVQMEWDSSHSLREAYLYKPESLGVRANVNLHTDLPGDRYLDVHLNNALRGKVPVKGAHYRGNADDNLQWVRAGTNQLDFRQAQTMPEVRYEGIQFQLESREKLATRDRKRMRVAGGGGFVTSEQVHDILAYDATGLYRLGLFGGGAAQPVGREIIPGSIEIRADGELIDSTLYTCSYSTGLLTFNRRDILDPTSIIRVSYRLRPLPAGRIDSIEIVPGNHFGDMAFSEIQVSPNAWLTARSAYARALGNDLINLGAPVELRSTAPQLMLKLTPDLTYNVTGRSAAGGVRLQSRLGTRATFAFRGVFADTTFVSTDSLSRGMGTLKSDLDYSLGYDVFPALPLGFRHQTSRSTRGHEARLEATGGWHSARFPLVDASVSRNRFYLERPDSGVGDTLDRQKDLLRLRVQETSSAFVQEKLSLHRFGYELSLAEFVSEDRRTGMQYQGGIVSGRSSLCPIQKLRLAGSGIYRRNPGIQPSREINPLIQFETMDLPKGVDLFAKHEWDFGRFTNSDSSSLELFRSGEAIFRPGAWFGSVGWISPRIGVSHRILGAYNVQAPGLWNSLAGSGFSAKPSEALMRKVGAHVLASDAIQYRNENRWTRSLSGNIEQSRFNTFNDVKWRLGGNNLWQTRWEYDMRRDSTWYLHRAYTRYDRSWNRWLQTKQGLYVSATRDTLQFGPRVTVGVDKGWPPVIKKLLNHHTIGLNWRRQGGILDGRPDITYVVYGRLVVAPNISVETSNGLVFTTSEEPYFDSFSGSVKVMAVF